jgi:hypothetical protein
MTSEPFQLFQLDRCYAEGRELVLSQPIANIGSIELISLTSSCAFNVPAIVVPESVTLDLNTAEPGGAPFNNRSSCRARSRRRSGEPDSNTSCPNMATTSKSDLVIWSTVKNVFRADLGEAWRQEGASQDQQQGAQ